MTSRDAILRSVWLHVQRGQRGYAIRRAARGRLPPPAGPIVAYGAVTTRLATAFRGAYRGGRSEASAQDARSRERRITDAPDNPLPITTHGSRHPLFKELGA
jgi:hypothetical protein